MTSPIRVAVTGAAGQIGYALIFRIASGEVFGSKQPVILHLVEVPPVMGALDGVIDGARRLCVPDSGRRRQG